MVWFFFPILCLSYSIDLRGVFAVANVLVDLVENLTKINSRYYPLQNNISQFVDLTPPLLCVQYENSGQSKYHGDGSRVESGGHIIVMNLILLRQRFLSWISWAVWWNRQCQY